MNFYRSAKTIWPTSIGKRFRTCVGVESFFFFLSTVYRWNKRDEKCHLIKLNPLFGVRTAIYTIKLSHFWREPPFLRAPQPPYRIPYLLAEKSSPMPICGCLLLRWNHIIEVLCRLRDTSMLHTKHLKK